MHTQCHPLCPETHIERRVDVVFETGADSGEVDFDRRPEEPAPSR